MRIKIKILTIGFIAFLLLTLLFVFGHINSLVSYQYEVKDFMTQGQELNERQNQIMNDIRWTEIAYVVFGLLSLLTILLRLIKPRFGERITYVP